MSPADRKICTDTRIEICIEKLEFELLKDLAQELKHGKFINSVGRSFDFNAILTVMNISVINDFPQSVGRIAGRQSLQKYPGNYLKISLENNSINRKS